MWGADVACSMTVDPSWSIKVEWGARGSGLVRAAREPQAGIGGTHAGFRDAQLAPHDVGALHERHALVVRDAPAQPLAAEATIRGDDQPLGGDVLESAADQTGDVLGRLDRLGAPYCTLAK